MADISKITHQSPKPLPDGKTDLARTHIWVMLLKEAEHTPSPSPLITYRYFIG